MNLEEVKREGPSYPQDIDWGFSAYCKYLDIHPEYEMSEGDILIFVVGHFPDELKTIRLGVGLHTPHTSGYFLRIDVFNSDTYQSQTNGLNFHTT